MNILTIIPIALLLITCFFDIIENLSVLERLSKGERITTLSRLSNAIRTRKENISIVYIITMIELTWKRNSGKLSTIINGLFASTTIIMLLSLAFGFSPWFLLVCIFYAWLAIPYSIISIVLGVAIVELICLIFRVKKV